MPKKQTLTITSTAIRHMPQFSRLLTIPLDKIAPWKIDGTTVVEASVNGIDLGRRSLKRWDDRDCWWIDLPDPLCQKAKIDTGDEVELTIKLASEALPQELQQLLTQNKSAKSRWDKMTTAQKRMLREEILAAKSSETRLRRAQKYLC